jgi:hypothetical protein
VIADELGGAAVVVFDLRAEIEIGFGDEEGASEGYERGLDTVVGEVRALLSCSGSEEGEMPKERERMAGLLRGAGEDDAHRGQAELKQVRRDVFGERESVERVVEELGERGGLD